MTLASVAYVVFNPGESLLQNLWLLVDCNAIAACAIRLGPIPFPNCSLRFLYVITV